jgi:hypothetical protein
MKAQHLKLVKSIEMRPVRKGREPNPAYRNTRAPDRSGDSQAFKLTQTEQGTRQPGPCCHPIGLFSHPLVSSFRATHLLDEGFRVTFALGEQPMIILA